MDTIEKINSRLDQMEKAQIALNEKICKLIEIVIEHHGHHKTKDQHVQTLYSKLPSELTKVINNSVVTSISSRVIDVIITTVANLIAGTIFAFVYKLVSN